jgi:hypothetical protein
MNPLTDDASETPAFKGVDQSARGKLKFIVADKVNNKLAAPRFQICRRGLVYFLHILSDNDTVCFHEARVAVEAKCTHLSLVAINHPMVADSDP